VLFWEFRKGSFWGKLNLTRKTISNKKNYIILALFSNLIWFHPKSVQVTSIKLGNLLAKGISVTPHDRFPEPYLNPMTPESWEVSLYNWRTLSAVNVAICDEVLNYKNLTHTSSTIIKQNTPILQQQREHSEGSKSISGIVSARPHLQNPKQTNNTEHSHNSNSKW